MSSTKNSNFIKIDTGNFFYCFLTLKRNMFFLFFRYNWNIYKYPKIDWIFPKKLFLCDVDFIFIDNLKFETEKKKWSE